MKTSFKDHFSGHSAAYRQARPTYPAELFAWLATQAPDRALVWDCGCGNGQASQALAEYFDQVVATDPSANQIAQAEARDNIEYRIEPSEQSSLADASASLVTVAQALHWFDHEAFYSEVDRVLKPGGVFAAWAYAGCSTGDPHIDRLIDYLYEELTGPHWPPERAYVDAGYRTLSFPFDEIAPPAFTMRQAWNLDQLLAYLRSWSATQRYIKANGDDPVRLVESRLRAAWSRPERQREIRWRMYLRSGKKRCVLKLPQLGQAASMPSI